MIEPAWNTIAGYGFGSSALDGWTWYCAQMLLGLTLEGDVAMQWGAVNAQKREHVFTVRRDADWTPTADRLKKDIDRLRHLRHEHGTVEDHLDVDVFSWIAWLLSRAEEYGGKTDSHGRYCREASIARLAGLDHEPFVDEMAATVRHLLIRYCKTINISVREHSPWPAGKRAAAWVSHDIDHAERRSLRVAIRKVAGALLAGDQAIRLRRWHDVRGLLQRPTVNPHWLMDEFSRISIAAHSASTFFVLPHTSPSVTEGRRRVRRYDIRQPDIMALLERLRDTGSELGLHITYDAHDEANGIASNLTVFEASAPSNYGSRGARSHYLRFRAPETWRSEQAAGLCYDSSLGWSSGWGFRSGSSLPYRPFDRLTSQPFDLWEMEVNLMDVAVESSEFVPAAYQLISKVAPVGGCAGILIHPAPWGGRTASEHLDIYQDLLECLSADGIWLATPSTIIEVMEQYERTVTSPTTSR